MFWLYCIGKVIVRAFFRLFTRLQVKGKENVPPEGALLVVSNHLNFNDPPLLGASLGRQVVFMAKEELFRFRPLAYFLSSLGSFPVHRGRLDREALYQADQVLAQGSALVMFPEGMRSKNGRLQSAFRGSTLIALRSGAQILPVGIAGTEKIKGITWLLRRPRITVNIGQPFYLPPVSDKLTRAEIDKLTHSTMERIAQLLPPEYRGEHTG